MENKVSISSAELVKRRRKSTHPVNCRGAKESSTVSKMPSLPPQSSKDNNDESDDDEPPPSSCVYQVGDRVDGFYKGFDGPHLFFPGHITAVHPDGTYDIDYDDGDKETHVAAGFIRKFEGKDEESAKSDVVYELARMVRDVLRMHVACIFCILIFIYA